jgi:hypothetical protein
MGFRRHPRAFRILATALALVLGVGGGLDATPAQAAKARVRISYQVLTLPGSWKGCVGEEVAFGVFIHRTTKVNGRTYPEFLSGGRVLYSIDNPTVGEMEPLHQGQSVGAPPKSEAMFLFRAKAAGRTRIVFVIGDTGEGRRVGTNAAGQEKKVSVEVVDCYDAYTSGLGTTFSVKDMGDLTKPFRLDGRISSSAVAGDTQFMFFMPHPQNRTTGGYVFVDTAWPTADPRARCTAVVSGTYDVVLYGNPAKPVEGDLLMDGTGVQVCGGISTPIDYADRSGFRIGFRPRQAP